MVNISSLCTREPGLKPRLGHVEDFKFFSPVFLSSFLFPLLQRFLFLSFLFSVLFFFGGGGVGGGGESSGRGGDFPAEHLALLS